MTVFDTATAAGRLRILWGATCDPELAMGPDEVADVETVLAEHAAMTAELERLAAELVGIGDEWQIRYKIYEVSYAEWTEPTRYEVIARGWLADFRLNNPKGRATLLHRRRSEWHVTDESQPPVPNGAP